MAKSEEIRQLAAELNTEDEEFFQREHTAAGIIEYRVDTILFQEMMDVFLSGLKKHNPLYYIEKLKQI